MTYRQRLRDRNTAQSFARTFFTDALKECKSRRLLLFILCNRLLVRYLESNVKPTLRCLTSTFIINLNSFEAAYQLS